MIDAIERLHLFDRIDFPVEDRLALNAVHLIGMRAPAEAEKRRQRLKSKQPPKAIDRCGAGNDR